MSDIQNAQYLFGGTKFSRRQRDVWLGIAENQTIKQIAMNLGISQKTVEYHITILHRKLGFSGTAALTRLAIRLGLIEA